MKKTINLLMETSPEEELLEDESAIEHEKIPLTELPSYQSIQLNACYGALIDLSKSFEDLDAVAHFLPENIQDRHELYKDAREEVMLSVAKLIALNDYFDSLSYEEADRLLRADDEFREVVLKDTHLWYSDEPIKGVVKMFMKKTLKELEDMINDNRTIS